MDDGLLRDLRLGLRSLGRSPGLAVLAAVAIALGTALSTAVFALVDTAILRPLPYPTADRMIAVGVDQGEGWPKSVRADLLGPLLASGAFEQVAGYYTGTVNVSSSGTAPERLSGGFVTTSFFKVGGLAPALGRDFAPEDAVPGATPVLILSHEAWKRHFGGDPRLVGRMLRANGRAHQVIGIAPEGFRPPRREDVWLPLGPDTRAPSQPLGEPMDVEVIALLREGVDLGEAQEIITGTIPLGAADRWIALPIDRVARGGFDDKLLAMILGAVLVFAIAIANAANLQLARFGGRTRELAIRAALGAPRRRVARELLLESGILGTIGGLLGLVLALWCIDVIQSSSERLSPAFWFSLRLDARVFVFCLAVSVGAGILAGFLPTRRVTSLDINPLLKDAGRTTTAVGPGRFSRSLGTVQLALSCMVLVYMGLAVKAVSRLDSGDFGYDPDRVLTLRLGLFEADYPSAQHRRDFVAALLSGLEARAGIDAATATTWVANGMNGLGSSALKVPREGDEPVLASVDFVDESWLPVLGADVLAGRNLVADDVASARPVALVNAAFAMAYGGIDEIVGREIAISGGPGGSVGYRVVGVTPDFRLHSFDAPEAPAAFYASRGGMDATFVTIAVRTALPRDLAVRIVRQELGRLDPNLPPYFVSTLREHIETLTWDLRLRAASFRFFGLSALLLAVIGISGLMSNTIAQRRHEIGIRLALGASRAEVARLVLRRALASLAAGLGAGVALAAASSVVFSRLLVGTDPRDPMVYALSVLVLALVALAACLVPLRRALAIHPFTGLRWG